MTEIFKVKVAKLVGNEYTVLGEYKNSVTPIRMRHNTCGTEWKIRPSNFTQGYRCPKCAYLDKGNKFRFTTEEFKEEVFALVGNEYTVLGEYKGAHIPILIRHNTCGHE